MLRIPDSGFLLREFRLGIRHFHIDQFLLGIIVVPREIENNGYAKSWGVNKMYYGLCENGEFHKQNVPGFRNLDYQT